ncbi:hypothetical protein, partial [Campylobacter sp. BCW_4332]|uniref:hypothetical protein n=1 Tax=Campylobacter sp. BCW_4332 TaxID=1903591 RepID=UPI000AFAE694
MNVVILGSSHSYQQGIPLGFKMAGWNVENFSITGSPSTFILHRIHDIRKLKFFEKADLVICESNTDDFRADFEISCQDINKAYQNLYLLKKKIVILLFQHAGIRQQNKITDNLHIYLANYYGFNLIDLRIERKIFYFFSHDSVHLYSFILKKIGKNIAKNFTSLKYPKKNIPLKQTTHFKVCHLDEMKFNNEVAKKEWIKTCIGGDFPIVLKLKDEQELFFPEKYYGYYIHSVFACNLNQILYSSLTITDGKYNFNSLLFPGGAVKRFSILLKINENTKIKCNCKLNGEMDKKVQPCEKPKINKNLNYVGLISFLLVKDYHNEDIDFETLAKENMEIDKEYNFNHLIPPMEWYKEIIDEYCKVTDARKLASLNTQISNLIQEKQNLQNDFQAQLNSIPIKKQHLELANLEQDLIIKKLESKKLAKSLGIKMSIINPKITFIQANSAKARIQNHLSYKLGQTLIENSKSILGYIRMPYVLSYIKDKHKFEQKAYEEKIKENPNLALPPLETYPDYNEALK